MVRLFGTVLELFGIVFMMTERLILSWMQALKDLIPLPEGTDLFRLSYTLLYVKVIR